MTGFSVNQPQVESPAPEPHAASRGDTPARQPKVSVCKEHPDSNATPPVRHPSMAQYLTVLSRSRCRPPFDRRATRVFTPASPRRISPSCSQVQESLTRCVDAHLPASGFLLSLNFSPLILNPHKLASLGTLITIQLPNTVQPLVAQPNENEASHHSLKPPNTRTSLTTKRSRHNTYPSCPVYRNKKNTHSYRKGPLARQRLSNISFVFKVHPNFSSDLIEETTIPTCRVPKTRGGTQKKKDNSRNGKKRNSEYPRTASGSSMFCPC